MRIRDVVLMIETFTALEDSGMLSGGEGLGVFINCGDVMVV